MRIGIITHGTRGDIQPFIALSIGLMERGHYVKLFAPENFKELIEGFKIVFSPMKGDIEELIHSPYALRLLRGGNPVLLALIIENRVIKYIDMMNEKILAESVDLEFFISIPGFSPTGYSIAEKYGKKSATIPLSMPLTTTQEFPFQMFDFFNSPWYNKFSYKIAQALFWLVIKKRTNNFRKQLKLPLGNTLKKYIASDILTLYPMSKYLISQPKDWPSNTHVTGFFTLPKKAKTKATIDAIPDEMIEWIAKGRKLIYIGFGSIPVPNQKLLTQVINEICLKTDYRIVYCTGWSLMQDLPNHPNIYITKYADHDWLFPKCSLAIIHGGIGTIAAVLKAKLPMIIFSIFADQPVNGKIIVKQKLGVHIPFRKVTVKKVIAAIETVQTPEFIKNAQEVGEKINAEDGVNDSIDKIEGYFYSQNS